MKRSHCNLGKKQYEKERDSKSIFTEKKGIIC